jgi:hypothetical protein
MEGVVRRGPITPVCFPDQPCDAPFSASFEIRDGSLVAGRFHSDSAGHYSVAVAPGVYTVVPDPAAPLMGASSQTRIVTVGPEGFTHADLAFDTGIR